MARILVVEDSSAFRAFIRAALEDAPGVFATSPDDAPAEVEIVEAGSGFDALRLLPRGQYDLVITDINMPDINGLELVRFIRESERHRAVAIILISTQSSEKDRARGLALGADAFLGKPFTVQELHAAIGNIWKARAARSSKAPADSGAATSEGSR